MYQNNSIMFRQKQQEYEHDRKQALAEQLRKAPSGEPQQPQPKTTGGSYLDLGYGGGGGLLIV